MKPDRDTYDDKHRANDPPPVATGDLYGPAFAADGELTSVSREAANGRFVERDTAATDFGVDRKRSGQFASKGRSPAPLVRDDDGTFESDAFAVGNGGAFDDEYDWGESP
jgi:hypothetical protein